MKSAHQFGYALMLLVIELLAACGGGGGGGGGSTTPLTLTNIVITPATATAPLGQAVNLTAIGTYSDASTANITSQVMWASDNTNVVAINSTTGIATGVAEGGATVTASASGITSSSASLTITAKALSTISISPTNPSSYVGKRVTFIATGHYSDGSTSNLSGSAIWASNNVAVATMTTTGMTSALVQGSAVITASANGITSNPAYLSVSSSQAPATQLSEFTYIGIQNIMEDYPSSDLFTDYIISIFNTTSHALEGMPVNLPPLDAVYLGTKIIVSSDGSRVFTLKRSITSPYEGELKIFNAINNTLSANITVGVFPDDMVLSKDGTRAYVLNRGNGPGSSTVSVIDTTTDALLVTVSTGVTGSSDIAVSPDGARVYVSNANGAVLVINTSNNELSATIPVPVGSSNIAVSHDSARVYVANSGVGLSVIVIDAATNSVLSDVTGSGTTASGFIAISPNGSRIYTASTDRSDVYVIDATNNTIVTTMAGESLPVDIAVSMDGTRVYTANQGNGGTITAFNAVTNTLISKVLVAPGSIVMPNKIIVSQDGTRVYGHKSSLGFGLSQTLANKVQLDDQSVSFLRQDMEAALDQQDTALALQKAKQWSSVMRNHTRNTKLAVLNTSTNTMLSPVEISFPDAPTIGSASSGNTQATVTFAPPAYSGGLPITDYRANCDGIIGRGTSSPITVRGLINGTAYTCTVEAENYIGRGLVFSESSNSVTPATVPSAPTNVSAAPGNALATVSFIASASNGGSAILGYTAKCGTITASATASPIIVAGLTNGTSYTCSVTAINAAGSSAASTPSNSVIPVAPTNQ